MSHERIVLTFPSNIRAPLRLNCYNFGDPLTFSLVSFGGQDSKLYSRRLLHDHIPAELTAFTSTSIHFAFGAHYQTLAY